MGTFRKKQVVFTRDEWVCRTNNGLKHSVLGSGLCKLHALGMQPVLSHLYIIDNAYLFG